MLIHNSQRYMHKQPVDQLLRFVKLPVQMLREPFSVFVYMLRHLEEWLVQTTTRASCSVFDLTPHARYSINETKLCLDYTYLSRECGIQRQY